MTLTVVIFDSNALYSGTKLRILTPTSYNDQPRYFFMLYKVVLTFESLGEILMCDHSNESY